LKVNKRRKRQAPLFFFYEPNTADIKPGALSISFYANDGNLLLEFKKKAATEECITMKHRVYQNRTLSFYLEF